MMSEGYWSHILDKRITRRRAIAATGASAVAAAILAACGGEGIGGAKDKSGLVSKASNTASQAKPGGIWQNARIGADVVTIDPNKSNASSIYGDVVPYYETLLRYGKGTNGHTPGNDTITGDAAESWELSPEGTQITLKLRPNHRFDPRPPTNGHVMTTADAKVSFDRTFAGSIFASDWLSAKSPDGMVDSVTFPDDRTIVMKMSFPYVAITTVLAHHSYFWILPREAEGGYDPRTEARGSGPFFLEKWEPSVGFTYTKNPDWHEKGRPFLSGIYRPLIADYAAGLAQFETGALWDFPVKQEDVLKVKQNHQEMILMPEVNNTPTTFFFPFSRQPNSPVNDVRVRRAFSMLIDRDAIITVLNNVDQFQQTGLPTETRWNSHVIATSPDWVDPKGKGLGEGAKFFQFNVQEAKALLSAAGYDKSQQLSFWTDNGTGTNTQLYQIMAEMLSEGGVNLDFKKLGYPQPWRDICQQSESLGFNGLCMNREAPYNDESYFTHKYTPQGKFRITDKEIPVITAAARKIRTEPDPQRQAEQIKQLQRDLAMNMYDMLWPGIAPGFTLNWPWLKNYGLYTAGGSANFSSSRIFTEYWYDASAKKA